MRTASFVLLLVAVIVGVVVAECPRRCECKWKSGKESVVCLGANLSAVPTQLDAGTQILDLSANQLLAIRADEFSAAGLLNLQKVFASRCRLRTIDRHAFRHLSNLVELDLSHNALAGVPTHAFAAIPELRDLRLSGNPISRLAHGAFAHVPQLVRLELTACRIAAIETAAFAGLERTLEWLKLDGNRVSVVDAAALSGLANLHGLELAGNPWNCSCALRPLRAWMMRSNVPFGVPPVCRHPRRLAARAWDRLELDEFACAPAIFAHDATAHGVEGRNVTMACGVTGVPVPHVRWMLRNRVIANVSGAPLRHGRLQYVVQLLNSTSDLTILAADAQDAGVYVCAAENKAGRVEASVTLAMSRRPAADPVDGRAVLAAAAAVLVAVLFVLGACVLAVGACAVRRRAGGRRRRADDDYEKIELGARMLAGGREMGNGRAPIERLEVPATTNGDYRVVPATAEEEDDDDDEEDELPDRGEVPFWHTPLHDTWIETQWDDLHIPRRCKTRRTTDQRNEQTLDSRQPAAYQLPSTSRIRPTSRLEGDEKTYPDLIENNNNSNKNNNNNNNSNNNINNNNEFAVSSRATSEGGGSATDISELFGSLPRKRTMLSLIGAGSQSPLLMAADSRYGSSSSSSSSHRPQTRHLPASPIRETPLLDVAALEDRIAIACDPSLGSVPPPTTTNLNAYDYHAAQLERFLEEYRTLQKELARMKETCDSMRQPDISADATATSTTHLDGDLSRYLLTSSPKAINNTGGLFHN